MRQMEKWEPGNPILEPYLTLAVEGMVFLKKKISGSPAYFINGNLFAGTQGKQIFLRLNKTDREYLVQSYEGAVPLEPVAGRPENEYVTAPYALYSDTSAFQCWVKRAFDHAAALPPRIGIS